MLRLYRRHTESCSAGRKQHDKSFLRCDCTLHVIGSIVRGEYVRESLHTRDYQEASRQVRDAEARGYWRKATGKEKAGPKTLESAIESFLADAAHSNGRNLREVTVARYRSELGKLLDFAGDVTIASIEPETIRRFRDSWKMNARTAAGSLARIRAFFKFAVDNEWITKNPALSVRVPKDKGGDRQKQPLAEDEIAALLKAAEDLYGPDSDIGTAILIMRYAGLRISDTVMLRADSLNVDTLSIQTIKTLSKVTIPLPKHVVDRLSRITPVKGYYFVRGSLRMQTQADLMRRRFDCCKERAGLPTATPHRLRHSYAVAALLAGISTDTVAKMLGHSSPAITAKFYSAFTKEREIKLVDEVRKLWEKDAA
jgi:site-specific recombinase XerD